MVNKNRLPLSYLLILLIVLGGCGANSSGPADREMIIPAADGITVLETAGLRLDISHAEQGYFMVRYTGTAKDLFLQLVCPDHSEYKYFLQSSQDYVTIPFSEGDGNYLVFAYEKIVDDQYSPIFSDSITVELSDPFGPFLCSNQYVDFDADSEVCSLADTLTKDCENNLDKVREIYQWVVRNIDYDHEKALMVSTGYLPDIEETLRTRKGICFDFAALMTAMLRSQGIPGRLNIGYLTEDIYHAWISVYLDETGWLNQVIAFDGQDWKLMDPTVASSSGMQTAEELSEETAYYIVRYVR